MSPAATCPSCQSAVEHRPVARHRAGGTIYRLFQCPVCDLQFWAPRQNDSGYFIGMSSVISDFGLQRMRMWHYPFFRRFPRESGRLLDVGCADGAFLAALQDRDFDLYGCDFDLAAIASGAKKRGLENLSTSSLSDYAGLEQRFDVITFFEVLEHQDYPGVFIEDVKRLLEADGWIAGSVPNRDRLIIRREWQDYPPGHFLYFSEGSLHDLLVRHGFTNITICSGDFRAADLGLYLENQLLGGWGDWIKQALKKGATGVNEAAARIIPVENLPQNRRSAVLMLIRRCRNLVLASSFTVNQIT
ncbi:MAG: class I SAM-dependent methyltransferase, partial [Actinomycetota bacterium]